MLLLVLMLLLLLLIVLHLLSELQVTHGLQDFMRLVCVCVQVCMGDHSMVAMSTELAVLLLLFVLHVAELQSVEKLVNIVAIVTR